MRKSAIVLLALFAWTMEAPATRGQTTAGSRSRQAATAKLATLRTGITPGTDATSVPTLSSDKPDYHPGEIVTLTGAGWKPGETVRMEMSVVPRTHGDVTLTSVADADGNFTNSDYVVQGSDLNVTFTVISAGTTSELRAQTLTFTDTATVTTATGGDSISADTNTTNGTATWATLTGPVLTEGVDGDVGLGTIILSAPTGFVFNTASNGVTVTITQLSGNKNCFALSGETLNSPGGTLNVTPTSTTITVTVTSKDATNGQGAVCSATWSGIQVRPSAGTPLASGNITDTGTATITGVTSSTNFGTLTEVAGAAKKLAFTVQPAGGPAGAVWNNNGGGGSGTNNGQPVVAVEDTYGNTVTSSSASVTLTLSNEPPSGGALAGCTSAVGAISGVATFSGCYITNTGTYGTTYQLTASSGTLTSAVSNSFTITNPTAVKLISAKATEQDGGVLLEWRTGFEVSNLGFHIYREDNGQRVQVTASSPVAGSALLAGQNTRLTAGNSYSWWDPQGTAGSVYFLEDLDISGERKMSDPVNVRPSFGQPAPGSRKRMTAASSRLLNEVGRAGADRAEFFRTAPSAPAAVIVEPPRRGAAQNEQYRLAASAAVKLGVQAEGWYRVTQAQLAAAGLSPTANPHNLQLYAQGLQQPILVEGQTGTTFTAIDFYGQGLDTIWSGTQVYWLVDGPGSGLRIQTQGQARGPAGAASFPFTMVWKPRTVYAAVVLTPNGDGNEFFGPVITTTPVSQNLNVTHLAAAGGSSTLQVTLQGATAGPHSVAVSLNGYALGNVTFQDLTEGVATFTVPALVEGANALTLTAQGGASDVSGVDNVQLTYPHSYIADSNSLRMTAASGQSVTVSGFTASPVQVIDITNPASVSLVPSSTTAGAVTFVPQGGGTRTLLAVASPQSASPASITANQPSSWHAAQPGGDMVIISHSSLLAAVAPLASLRQSQGHTVKVIDVEDLYDEFNFGSESPYAIQNFLLTAKANWTTEPAFVLLMGNGTFDPRNYLGTAVPDLVVVKLVDTSLNETASDDWFADFNGDGIPEMAIGRIPAETAADATTEVNRLIAYDRSGSGGWKNQALLVAGADQAGDNFEGFTASVEALLPGSVTVTQILAGSDPNAASDLLAQLNSGQVLVNYVGHGSDDVWLGLFDDTNAAALTNGAFTPLVLSMTCLNGYFQDVYTTALAKALLTAPNGGAVAVWASSGLTDASPQSNIDQAMVQALYGAQPMTIGQAAAAAKKATTDMDVRRTWILFGDPAMKLQ